MVDGQQVILSFIQKTPVAQEQEEDQSQEHQEEDIFDFTVYVVKDKKGIAFDCSAINGQVAF